MERGRVEAPECTTILDTIQILQEPDLALRLELTSATHSLDQKFLLDKKTDLLWKN